MNAIAVLILTVIIAEFVLAVIADLLNIGSTLKDPPTGLTDIYSADQYEKSQQYLKVNTYFDWVESGFGLAVTLIFWFGKGFSLLDNWVRSLHSGPIVAGLVFICILLFIKALLSLPFSIYGTFVIEEKFGFNKTSVRTFILDRLKGLGLFLLIGVPLLSGILAFLEYTGNAAWLYCWGTVVAFMLIFHYIAPTWIMPLFNKFTPVESGELKTAILSHAEKINFPLENVFVMDGSKRSSKSNAFFTGFGRHRRIVLFDTLIHHTTTNEMVSIVAHEMGHYKKHHILISLLVGIAHMGVLFYLMSFFLTRIELFNAFYVSEISMYAGLIFFSVLYSPIEFFIGIMMQLLSRKNEFEADRFAAETTGNPEALSSALKKLAAKNLSNLTPHPFFVFLNYSHPPLRDRLNALTAMPSSEP